MSDGYEGREIVAQINSGVNGPTITATPQVVQFQAVQMDTVNGWDLVNNRYVVKVSGRYKITVRVLFNVTFTGASQYNLSIQHNGVAIATERGTIAAAGFHNSNTIVAYADAKAGDYFDIVVNTNNGPSTYHVWADGNFSKLQIERISSPQTIAMGEVVAGYATNSSGQSIPTNVDTALTNWTVVSDTHGIFNPSTGELTINRSGFLDISFVATFVSNPNGIRTAFIRRFSPSLVDIQAVDIAPTGNGQATCVVTVKGYPVKAGDVFKPMVWHTVSPSLALLAGAPQRNNFSWRIY
jgi:hypothetical protein